MSTLALKKSIAQTLAYASFFNFPLTSEELHYWLITPVTVSKEELQAKYRHTFSPKEKKHRSRLSGYTNQKISLAKNFAKIIGILPTVKLVAITGSVAAKNSKEKDDIDLLMITSPNTLWLTRPLVLVLAELFFSRRLPGQDPSTVKDTFCINLWLDENCLEVPDSKKSLYTAHEVLQVCPVLDKNNTFIKFIKQNSWTANYLANAYDSIISSNTNISNSRIHKVITGLFYPINYLFFHLQILYMHKKQTREFVSVHSAYFHTVDFTGKMLEHMKTFKVI